MSTIHPSRASVQRRALRRVAWALLLLAGTASAQDADGDRLSDAVEGVIGTNPALADTDGDGDSDWLEYYRCRNPLDAADRGPAKCRAAVGGSDPGWRWSESGPVAGMNCLRITNANRPDLWANTYLCTSHFNGWRWSQSGPIAGLPCIPWKEPNDPAWNNDLHFLCGLSIDAPLKRFPFDFSFVSSQLQQAADACVQLTNAAAPPTWSDNWFCHRDDRALYESVTCLNCDGADLANGALLSLTVGRTTGGEAFSGLTGTTTIDGETCAPVVGQAGQCRLPANRFGDLGKGRLLETFPQRLIVDFPAPVASSVTPASLPAIGGTVTINGQFFGIDAASVTVGGAPCQATSRTPTTITCQAPPRPAGMQPVVVTVGNQSSNPLTLAYRAAPVVKGIGVVGDSPTAGGGRIVVLGSGLDDAPQLTVGGAACTPRTIDPDLFVCLMPPGRGTGVPVSFIVGGVAFSDTVDYDPPAITGVAGTGGPTSGGIVIGVLGRNFGALSAGVLVTVGDAACQVGAPGTQVSHARIDCLLPPGQGAAAPVKVSVLGRDSNTQAYAYAAPTLLPFGDLRIGTAGGELLEVRGSNLGTSGTVRIGGALCRSDGPGASHGHSLIRCITPEGLGASLPVLVNISGQVATGSVSYRPPVLTGGQLAPGPTLGGNEIVLQGSDLGGSSLALPRSVRIDNRPCDILTADHAQVRCRVGPGQGSGLPLVITVGGQDSNSLNYAYRPPLVTEVVPGTLPTAGGIPVTVRGQDFGLLPTVRIGDAACDVTFAASTHDRVVCTAPAGAAGVALLRVDAGNQQGNGFPLQYDAAPVMVTLAKGGDGFGGIASTPSGLACDGSCIERENLFPPGTVITLTASAAAGSTFLGWQGPCTGSAPACTFTASADVAVTATFGSALFSSGFEAGEAR